LQVKLLRALQERKFERLGSNELLPMRCRVIAATKGDLLHPPAELPFRRDLYYRLSVVVLHIPPLRERREDILQLFHHFLLQAALRYERRVPELTMATSDQLMHHDWPGNVRELQNSADRLVLGLPLLERADGDALDQPRSLDDQLNVFERHLILQALSNSGGRVAAASEALGVPRKTFYDKLKRLGLSVEDYKGG